jgi:dihydropyrimidinase
MKEQRSPNLLVRGGTVVTSGGVYEADLLIEGGRIVAIGTSVAASTVAETLDAAGCLVLPGVIDAHTHVKLDTGIYRTDDSWYDGTRAASCGGVTTVIDFATQFEGQGLRAAVNARRSEARDAVVDYSFHVMVTDLSPGNEGELASLIELGTPSVKLYTTYRPNYYADDATIFRLMKASVRLGITPLIHCENDALVSAATEELVERGQTSLRHHALARPPLAEQEAVQRILLLAEAARCPVHIVHCSTSRSVEMVADARRRGQRATCETCPQYLLLDSDRYAGPEPWRFILQPPLRRVEEIEGLWEEVAGGRVDMITTDHCDYSATQKTAADDFTKTPGGLPGLESLLQLMYTHGVSEGRISLSQLSRMLSVEPARVWGLWPRKGALIPGAHADVVVYDPEPEGVIRTDELHHVGGYSPYEGMRVKGQVRYTISRGRLVFADGRFDGQPGWGQFVHREARPV